METKKEKPWLLSFTQLFQKKNRLFLLGLGGILLIFLSDALLKPEKAQRAEAGVPIQAQAEANEYVQNLERRLTDMIASVQGAGKATVMITLDTSGETVYARNEKSNTETQSGEAGVQNRKSSFESDYPIIDTGSSDAPIVEARLLPEIKGVAVVCEGGDDITVISRVTELVSVVLGLSTNRICVTKMI
ncbi:MAG: stage III sporulation protein AG [Ruthenibacterium sp.]